jgi:hypothetical protein
MCDCTHTRNSDGNTAVTTPDKKLCVYAAAQPFRCSAMG